MKNLIRKWLGIEADDRGTKIILIDLHNDIRRIDAYLEARAPCKICGHHRYTKAPERHDEIERKRRKKTRMPRGVKHL